MLAQQPPCAHRATQGFQMRNSPDVDQDTIEAPHALIPATPMRKSEYRTFRCPAYATIFVHGSDELAAMPPMQNPWLPPPETYREMSARPPDSGIPEVLRTAMQAAPPPQVTPPLPSTSTYFLEGDSFQPNSSIRSRPRPLIHWRQPDPAVGLYEDAFVLDDHRA